MTTLVEKKVSAYNSERLPIYALSPSYCSIALISGFSQKTLVNARRKSLFPVVLQRQQLADGLAKYLNQLGLERRHKVKTLHEILTNDTPANGNGAADDEQP